LKKRKEEEQVTYNGRHIRLKADFSAEILQSKRAWNEALKALKENDLNRAYTTQKAIIHY
jgi:hypothetical protein